MGKLIAIDFGHTYATMGYIDEKGVYKVIDNMEGEIKTPMAAFFDGESTFVVGCTALAEGAFEPEALLTHCKQYLGSDFTYSVKEKEFSATDVACLMLRKLIYDAELGMRETVDGVVFGYPTYWGEKERRAMENAVNNVCNADGCKIGALGGYPEPLAAALGYASLSAKPMKKRLLVCDLGGTTFDCTVVGMDYQNDFSYTAQVQAKGGNRSLGGENWDTVLADMVRKKFCAETGADEKAMKNDPDVLAWFCDNLEKAKRKLSSRELATLAPNFDGNKARIEITRTEFEEATKHLALQMINCVRAMLATSGLSMEDIDEILLVGGGTCMPQIVTAFEKTFEKPITQGEYDKMILKGLLAYSRGAEIQTILASERQRLTTEKTWRETMEKEFAAEKAKEQAKAEQEMAIYRDELKRERMKLEAELRALREQTRIQKESVCWRLYLVDEAPREDGVLLNSIGCMVKSEAIDGYCEVLSDGMVVPSEGVLQAKKQFVVAEGHAVERVVLDIVTKDEGGYRNIGQLVWSAYSDYADERFIASFSLTRKGCLEVKLTNLGNRKETVVCFEGLSQIKIASEEKRACYPFCCE